MKCLNEEFSKLTIPELDEIVEKNWETNLPDKSQAPSYVSTYVNNDKGEGLKDVIYSLGEKILDIGSDFVKYLNSFDTVKIKKFFNPKELGSNYSIISNYEPDSNEKYALVGSKDKEEVIIGALPQVNNEFVNTKLLLDSLSSLENNKEININKDKFTELVSNAYEGKFQKANPLSLSKVKGEGIRQTLSELKERYDSNYKYIFSSPYIVTGQFSVSEDYTGRSVIFYNKFPENGLSVDSIINEYGGVNRKHQYKMLGMIPLQNNVYTSLDSLLEDVEKFSGEDLDNSSYGFFASHPSLNKFYNLLIRESTSSLGDFAEGIREFKVETSDGYSGEGTVVNSLYTPNAKNFIQYLRKLKKSNNKFYDTLNNLLQDNLGEDFQGIYVNPIILKNFTEYKSGLARIDSSLGDLLDRSLYIDGLRQNVVQPQRLEFKFKDTLKDISDLLNPDYKSPVSNFEILQPLEYNSIVQKNIGKEIKPVISEVLGIFEKLGISAYDLDSWVKNVTSEVLLNSDKQNFGLSLQKIVEAKKSCI